MSYSLTVFKNQFDNKTDKRTDPEDIYAFMYKLSKLKYKHKKQAPLISPACYTPGTTRKNANVTEWGGWAALDVDDYDFDPKQFKEILYERYGNYSWLCYSTASSTVDHPKFRLVFKLSRRPQTDEIKKLWFALNKELGEITDGQTKDLSRMYYVPGTYNDAFNFIFDNASGSIIDVDEIIAKHPNAFMEKARSFIDRLPKEMQNQILEHRKAKMTNTDITWSGYRDCPFVSKQQVNDYKTISGTGWYAQMYKMMVTIACNAVKRNYPITAYEIEELVREIDSETGNWYANRPINAEANNALEYAYRNTD